MTTKANRIVRYYDTHEMEGAELTESRLHRAIIAQLILIVGWIFNGKNVGVTGNINLYQTDHPKEPSKSPDIVVIEGLETAPKIEIEDTPSYYVGQDGPPPLVVFEVASRETWRQDLDDKPGKYETMGVREYFVFDPNTHTLWTGQWRGFNRLIGWRRNLLTGLYELLEKDPNGRLWSEELQSWLVMEETELQLYTADGQLRISGQEAEALRADTEARLKEAAIRQAKEEARLKDAAIRQANAESRLKEEALLKAARMAEKLRQLGIDPEA